MATDSRSTIKARISSSLFGSRGEDGLPIEQYITHVKISEDPDNPSAPSPPGTDASKRKHRYIVVSVQRNGIVRIHKSRENANGTFSIGKSWGMDQLEKLQETDTLGFIITIQKPYYWMTDTPREKYAFVTAIIQVYRKFTGGKSPEVIGFESIFRQPGSQSSRREQAPPVSMTSTSSSRIVSNPYASQPSSSNPYAASQSEPQANPYDTASSNPYAKSSSADPYASSVGPLKSQRRSSEASERRPPPGDRALSREGSRTSPERPRSRDKHSRDLNNGIPPVPAATLNISRQMSSSAIRPTPLETSGGPYDSASTRSKRLQDDDSGSTSSMGSRSTRTTGTRSIASVPAIKGTMSSQRTVAESPGRPDSSGRSTPPSPTKKPIVSSKQGPKLNISISTSVPAKLKNGPVTPTTPAAKMKSPLRRRPRSIDDAAPSEEMLSAAMLEMESLLTSFDWTNPTPCAARLEALLTDELATIESQNVHALFANDGQETRDFINRLDQSIAQCEQFDEMLTLYLVELQAIADDVNFIESENRGLHMRTANERALEKELSELLKVMTISPREFEALKQESLEKTEGIERTEQSLLQVYRALKASSGLADQRDIDGPKENMQIIREMRRMTGEESERFLARLKEFVKIKFQAELLAIPSGKNSDSIPTFPDHSASYSYFYRYASFILFAKETNLDAYADLCQLYLVPASNSYKEDFRAFVAQWKVRGRKSISDDLEILFSMVKDTQSTVSAVRSATIKRTGTVAKTLRSPLLDGTSRSEKERERNEQDGKIPVGEIFDEILSVIVPTMTKEQSFIMEFLQLLPSTKWSYEEFVTSSDKTKWMTSLDQKRPKTTPKQVFDAMEQLLPWLPDELTSLVEWCRASDILQLITVMGVLEKYIKQWEETDQIFLVKTLSKQLENLGGLFHRFVDEQVRAIEDMKVTAKKRQGVLLMFKILPGFVEKIETQFESPIITSGLAIRQNVNEGYEKISKTMFDSLQAIAKDTASHQGPGTKDEDDKEQLNSHISMIENMHYYRETVETRGNTVLLDFKEKAQALYSEHLGMYTKMVIRRPLGKLLDFLQGVETFVQSNPSEDVTARISFSKSAFKKVLMHYDPKEIRKGIELLHKRVDKHLGQVSDDADAPYSNRGPAIAKALVQDVWKECQKEYRSIVDLCKRIISSYYPEGVSMDFTVNDINEAFAKRG